METHQPVSWGTERLHRKEGHLPNHPTHSSCAFKYTDFFLGEFPLRPPQLRSLKSLLCTPLQAIHCVRKYCSFLGGRNQTELYSFAKNKDLFLSVKQFQNVFNALLLLSAALFFLNWTFQIIWMPAQIIWQRLDCWQVGCCSGNFKLDKKKKLNQSTKHKTAKQITHWLVSHIPLRLLIRLYPWLPACWSTDGRTGCRNTSLAHSSAGEGIPSAVGEYFLGNLSSTYQCLSTAEEVFLFLKQDLKEIICDFQYFFQISYSSQNTEQS